MKAFLTVGVYWPTEDRKASPLMVSKPRNSDTQTRSFPVFPSIFTCFLRLPHRNVLGKLDANPFQYFLPSASHLGFVEATNLPFPSFAFCLIHIPFNYEVYFHTLH